MITLRPRRAAAVVLRQLYLLRGSVARVIPLFAWVAVDIVLWGFMSRWLNGVARPGYDFVPALLGAVLLWDFLTRVMQGVTMAFFEDVWSRNFLNVFATPLSVAEYLAGLVASSVLTSLVGLAVMLAVAGGGFGLSLLAYGAALAPFVLVLFLFGIALGVLGAAIVLRLGPAAEWFVWPIPALVSPFAGVFYPLAALPAWMQGVARLLPPSYVFEGMRAVAAGSAVSGPALVRGAALAALDVLLACWVFARVFRYAVRTGLIARYSAESVS
jgi:ABC-2 type transport system permease protein